MQSIVLTDHTGARAEILPEKGATVISYRSRGQEAFYRDQENLDSPERPRCGVPFLFPVFGRTPEGSPYPMEIHGFGHTSSWQVLSREEYLTHLRRKLDEEVREYHESGENEELADILEVVYALAAATGCPEDSLNAIRREKAQKRGGFSKKILLKTVK